MAQQRKPTEARQEEVARAALRILGEQGPAAVTTSALAAAVGVTSGALFRHFPTVEAIVRQAAACAVKDVEQTFPEADGPPLDRLLDLAERRVRLLSAQPGIAWLLRSENAPLSLPPEAVADLRQVARRSRDFLVEAIREGAGQGSIRDDIAPEVLVVPVIGAIQVLSGLAGVHGRSPRVGDAQVEPVLEALRRLLARQD